MDVKRKKIVYWLLQIIGWFMYGTLLFLAAYRNANNQLEFSIFFNLTLYLIVGILLSHLLRFLYLRNKYFQFNAPLLVSRIVIYSGIVSFTYTLINKLLFSIIYLTFTKWDLLTILLNTSSIFVVFILWSSIYITYHLFEESRKKEINNLLLTKTQTELELQNLRAQLNPHFLFNSLNAIRALIEIEPTKAKNGINLLSNLLRSTLKLNSDKLVPIHKEMELVDAYLQLEKIRFEERLEVRSKIDEGCLYLEIPAFTIQTLVENSIKHGISQLIDGGFIEISVYRNENFCRIIVLNSGTLSKNIDLGIGLDNLKKRFKLQYQDQFTFSIISSDDCVEVAISIPANISI
jgi:two-component system LytT family sensor kinase